MKELIQLYCTFFYLGLVNFGGGYAMIPLLQRELVDKRGWTTELELTDYYAIGQCTPGAIAVNVSTFIGYKKKGVLGGIVATLGFVSPAFIIIFIIASLLTRFADNIYVQNALAGINVCVFFLVAFAVSKLAKKSLPDWITVLICVVVSVCAIFIPAIPLFVYVIASGILGFLICFGKEKHKEKKMPKEEIEETKQSLEEDSFEKNASMDESSEKTVEKASKRKGYLEFITGMATGLILGILGVIPAIFLKKKKYREGFTAALCFWAIMAVCLTFMLCNNKNTAYFQLYFNFFRIGICAFGGGLATIPFLYELGETTGWFTATDVTNMIAVAESTPGAMGINMSTYVGYTVGALNGNLGVAFVGSLLGTIGLVTPSIIVIEIICLFLDKFRNNKYVNYVFYGLRANSIGLIIRAAYSILTASIFHMDVLAAGKQVTTTGFFNVIKEYLDILVNWKALGVGLIFGILIFKYKKHPVIYIAGAAVVGILLQMGV